LCLIAKRISCGENDAMRISVLGFGAVGSQLARLWSAAGAMAVVAIGLLAAGWTAAFSVPIAALSLVYTCSGLIELLHYFYRGLSRFITHDETKGFGALGSFGGLRFLANGNLFGVPMPFVLLIVISLITWVLLHRSVYGRYLFATGRNAEASRYAGIDTRRIVTLAYVSSGLLTAISGIIFAFYTNSVAPANHGNAYELYGIAAAVLGGCSLRGGEGSVVGILIGAALLQVLRNLVNLLGIPSSLDFAVMGGVILIGVMADQFFADRRNRRRVVMTQEAARAEN